MSRFFDVVSKPARDMAAHFPTASPKQTPTDAQPQLIKLDSNENPFGPSPRAMEAMRSALATANFYPDDDSTELRRTLALHHEVSRDQILVTSGSTEMLADHARPRPECSDQRTVIHHLLDGRACHGSAVGPESDAR
jgi:histidinol-phosphate/aromatic aminotransferase/cobyric acid decarboxylase-like protein